MQPIVDPALRHFYADSHNRMLGWSATLAVLAIGLAAVFSSQIPLALMAVPLYLLGYSADLRRRLGIGIHWLYPSELDGFERWRKYNASVPSTIVLAR